MKDKAAPTEPWLACDWRKISRAGIVGMPPRALIRRLHAQGVEIYDLDEPQAAAGPGALESAAPFLPQVYCAILRTVVGNAINLTLDAIFIDTGPGKCDGARYTARILGQALTIPVISCCNQDQERLGHPLCRGRLPLLEKLRRITAGVKNPDPPADSPSACPPTAGFWGVPPRDFAILELFPDTTHVYGWSRCLENKTPADHELEASSNPAVPTVFFAQSFCPKTALARFLAERHPSALYLDADTHTSGSARAKIQAFLELSGVAR